MIFAAFLSITVIFSPLKTKVVKFTQVYRNMVTCASPRNSSDHCFILMSFLLFDNREVVLKSPDRNVVAFVPHF